MARGRYMVLTTAAVLLLSGCSGSSSADPSTFDEGIEAVEAFVRNVQDGRYEEACDVSMYRYHESTWVVSDEDPLRENCLAVVEALNARWDGVEIGDPDSWEYRPSGHAYKPPGFEEEIAYEWCGDGYYARLGNPLVDLTEVRIDEGFDRETENSACERERPTS